MSIQYRCRENELLDEICHHYYGSTEGVVEQVLLANPRLAQLGVLLPEGTMVDLPPITLPESKQDNIWA